MSVSPERQRILDYLAQFGLDGTEISADDWDESGFTLVRNERTRHPWPDGLSIKWLVTLVLVADRAEFRQAGIKQKDIDALKKLNAEADAEG